MFVLKHIDTDILMAFDYIVLIFEKNTFMYS